MQFIRAMQSTNRWNNLSKLLANKFEVEIWTVRREKRDKASHKNIKIRSHSDPMFTRSLQ